MKAFISFGAGGQNYINACNRIKHQVDLLDIFDIIKIYTEEDLKADTEFWKTHSEFIEANKRGYGYWLWKPYIIKKTMDIMGPGTILFYADCGCEIDIRKKKEIEGLISKVNNELLIASLTGTKEQMYCKGDVFEELEAHDNAKTEQRQASAILLYNCDKTNDLVNEWFKISSNYHMIDDSPSVLENYKEFKEHRHDQSIFSLLTKKHDLFSKLCLIPSIDIARNKSGTTRIIYK